MCVTSEAHGSITLYEHSPLVKILPPFLYQHMEAHGIIIAHGSIMACENSPSLPLFSQSTLLHVLCEDAYKGVAIVNILATQIIAQCAE